MHAVLLNLSLSQSRYRINNVFSIFGYLLVEIRDSIQKFDDEEVIQFNIAMKSDRSGAIP